MSKAATDQRAKPRQPLCGRVALIGVGLIGGSLALALRRSGAVAQVVGYDRDPVALERAHALGVIDNYAGSLAQTVKGAELVIIATPVLSLRQIFTELKPLLETDAIITDVASVKEPVVTAFKEVFGSLSPRLVPGHPIAGSERSGVEAANAELFLDHKVILTPLPQTDPVALRLVTNLWAAAGAQVVTMTVEHHDQVLAATSHLPHLLAYALVDTLAKQDESLEIFRYAAGGFRDFTRIASSDPRMWHDICLANSRALLHLIDRFSADLAQLRQAIAQGDGAKLAEVFCNAKAARDHFIQLAAGQEQTAAADTSSLSSEVND